MISAVRACEDLQWVAGVVQPIHWRLAKAGAQSGAQEYASPVMLRHLVEAAKSADDRAVVAMALVSYLCFLRVAKAASVRAGDVRDRCYVVFWNSKTGDEGWQRRPIPEWLRPYVEWLLEWAEDRGLARDDLLFPAGAAQLKRSLADLVRGTTGTGHRWHSLRRGGAAPCWKRSLELPHFKWWGRWAATATGMAYFLRYRDEDVVAPLCLPQVWSVEPRSLFVEPQKVWGDIMYEGQRHDKNKPVWGRGERRRAAPSMVKGKRYAGEPRSDAADLGSSSDDSDSGVSADEGVVQRPGVQRPSGVVQPAAGKRGSGRGGGAGARSVGDGAQRGAGADSWRARQQAEQSGAGSSNTSTRDGGEFKFTPPPSAEPGAGEVRDPWRFAHTAHGVPGAKKRPLAGRALSVPPRRTRGEALEVAQNSRRGAGARRVERLLCFVSWELDCASCFSKIPKYDKPLLRRIFRRGTNNNTISKT